MTDTLASVDICVAGAGAAGLSAAIALAKSGFSVICAGPLDSAPNGRTVALFEGSLRFFKSLNLWDHLRENSTPIERLSIVDATGARIAIPPLSLAAKEIGLPALGANIENHILVAELARLAADIPGLVLHHGKIKDVRFAPDHCEIDLDNGGQVQAKLLVAADGRESLARQKSGISTRRWSYPQTALTVILHHHKPHRSASTEFHTRNGPCTFVPLKPEPQAPYRSSLVWLMSKEEAARRLTLTDTALGAELDAQTGGHLGGALPQGPRGFFPMAGMRTQKIVKPRIALTGEAAHVFPPLAAQGLNLSLRDVADLTDCLEDARAAGQDIGSMEVLSLYEKRHQSDIALRTNGVDLLNRSLLIDFLPLDYVRYAGAAAFAMFGPLRRSVLWEGLVPDGYLPRLMRQPALNRRLKREEVRANSHLERQFGQAAP